MHHKAQSRLIFNDGVLAIDILVRLRALRIQKSYLIRSRISCKDPALAQYWRTQFVHEFSEQYKNSHECPFTVCLGYSFFVAYVRTY